MQRNFTHTVERATKKLIQESLAKGASYQYYRRLVAELASKGKSTGLEQTEALSSYTILNDRRIKRFDKTVKIDTESIAKIKGVSEKITMLVLTESWCGDAAPTLPVMNKIAEINEKIDLKIVLRDENLELMDHFLTNGSLSIPKLIFLDAEHEPFASWGPRPEPAAKLVQDHKEKYGELLPEIKEEIQLWYNRDKGRTSLQELLALLPME